MRLLNRYGTAAPSARRAAPPKYRHPDLQRSLEHAVAGRGPTGGWLQPEALRRLAIAAEASDPAAAAHVDRTSRYCAILAARLGLDVAACQEIRLATQLHDVGKAGLPAEILTNPALLTPEEREAAEEHCEIGFRMLSGSGSTLLDLAAQVALTHHERVDGTGYPNGLPGAEIPLVGRIAAIADVFDALTSDRPYRRAWPVADAVEFMRSQRGTHFNHELLDRFFDSLPDVLAVRELYPDGTDDACPDEASSEKGSKR